MSVAYSVNGSSFFPGTPGVWAESHIVNNGILRNFDIAPDGKRLAALVIPEETAPQKPLTHLTVLMNFSNELSRRMPIKK
jgi:hypothetical protein